MGTAVTNRALRRETKRTIGHQLSSFASDQHARLVKAEAAIAEGHVALERERQTRSDADANQIRCIDVLKDRLDVAVRRADAILDRSFVGRLRWLFSGR